jgi:hypothetical protein
MGFKKIVPVLISIYTFFGKYTNFFLLKISVSSLILILKSLGFLLALSHSFFLAFIIFSTFFTGYLFIAYP